MKKFLSLSAAAVVLVFALAGCARAANPGSALDGMNHGPASSSQAPADATHNAADTMFAQMMIPHHAQAIQMSDIMLAKMGLDPKIVSLVTDIKAAQGPEIEKMTGWLTSWGEATKMSGSHAMNGMLSSTELDQLAAAQGAEAGKLFLEQMIAHHDGAVEMAAEAVRDGKSADVIALAKSIVASQETEIKVMKEMLAAL